jgi:hypothetical protein
MSWQSRIGRVVGATMLDREDPGALGLMRIVLVTVFTLALLTHVGAVAEYFSDASVLAGEFARKAFDSRWSLFFHVTDPWAVRAIFAIGVVAHLLWLVGLYTRAAAAVAWLVWTSMMGRHPLLYSLADQLLMVLVTLAALMPTGRGLSLDARWRGKGGSVPVWCRRMVQLQLAVLYVGTGALKTGETWRVDGTALYYSLSNPYNRHFDVQQTLAVLQPWVLRPMTWAVLVWEVAFGGFVAVHWIREILGRPRRLPDLRKPFLGFGIAMHAGIQAMLYVAWFSPLAVGAYTAFLSPAEAGRLVERVRSLSSRFRAARGRRDTSPHG